MSEFWLGRSDRHGGLGSRLRCARRFLATAGLVCQARRARVGLRRRRAAVAARGPRPRGPGRLRELPTVEVLSVMLLQNYVITTDATGREVVRARLR